VINNLEKQLEDEKQAREQLRSEIEELKKMNSELCNAIMSQSSKKK
jgi:predicted RNase H-like nuclease (RuvC/YqgF family)